MAASIAVPESQEQEPAAHQQPVVSMRSVTKVFGEVEALRALDLEIQPGEIVGVIGPSGSGKTTTIRLMLGLYQPTEGDVLVGGVDPAPFTAPDREKIGYLPQHFLLYPDLTAEENIRFVAGTYGLGWRVRRRRVRELLALVELTDAQHRQAAKLSGGMQRRLALACALVHEPAFIVLDEPTAGQDPVLRQHLWDVFRSLQAQGRTFVVTTQYVTEAEYCDRVVLIDHGRAAAQGTPEELRRKAFGGDVVRVVVPDLDRSLVNALGDLPFTHRTEWRGEDELLLMVDDAGSAIPVITQTVRDRGSVVTSIEEFRQPFDRVFVQLVQDAE